MCIGAKSGDFKAQDQAYDVMMLLLMFSRVLSNGDVDGDLSQWTPFRVSCLTYERVFSATRAVVRLSTCGVAACHRGPCR